MPLAAAKNWPTPRILEAVLLLGACWMMLCGPATESASYVLLAPSLYLNRKSWLYAT